jgi:hypothetical protein
MNGGQPAQQELFQAEFSLGIKKKIENVLFYQTQSVRDNITATNYQGPLPYNPEKSL